MSASTVSSKSTNTSMSNTDSANTARDDREESSSESDNEGNAVVKSPDEKAAIDDIWFQILWILKLGSEDFEYLDAEVGKLLETSPHWHDVVFSIPRKGKGERHMISLRKCKARLRNHATVYNMVVAADALLKADDDTLHCVFKKRSGQLKCVREWLELFDLVFRRIVDAVDSNLGVENDKETRQIFSAILKKKEVFDVKAVKTAEVLPYSKIKEYANKDRQHKITNYPDDKKMLIKKWLYPGWLQDMTTENGKLPQQSLFHKTLLKEAGRRDNEIAALRKLEAEFREVLEAPKRFKCAEEELEAAEKELEAATKKHNAARKEDKPAKERYEAAKKKHEAAKKEYAAAKEENDPIKKSKRLDDIAQRRDRLKEEQKKVYLETKGDYRRKEEERSRKKREKKEERRKEKAKKGKKAVEWMEVFSGKRH